MVAADIMKMPRPTTSIRFSGQWRSAAFMA